MLSRPRPRPRLAGGRAARRLTPTALILGGAALALDLGLITASIVRHYVDPDGAFGFLRLGWFDGNKDRTFAEISGDLQLLLAAILLLWLAAAPARKAERFRDAAVYGAWALVLLAMGIDDFFRVHEEVGRRLAAGLDLPAVLGLRAQDLGELLVWAMAATALGVLLLASHLVSRGRPRRDSVVFFGLAFFLALFAVGLDMMHFVVADILPRLVVSALSQLEIAGELVAMTLMMIWAVHIFTRPVDPGAAGAGRLDGFAGARPESGVRELG